MLFHGTSPNQQSTRCRYAQYLKAFPRGNYHNYINKSKINKTNKTNKANKVHNTDNTDNDTIQNIDKDCYNYHTEHIARLKRRANTLLKQLIIHNYFDKNLDYRELLIQAYNTNANDTNNTNDSNGITKPNNTDSNTNITSINVNNSNVDMSSDVIQFYCSLLDENTIRMFGFDLLQ